MESGGAKALFGQTFVLLAFEGELICAFSVAAGVTVGLITRRFRTRPI